MGFSVSSVSIFAGVVLSGAAAWADGPSTVSAEALVESARAGGLVIYVRHATTERDYADQVTAVIGDCSTQRTLSEAGWAEARAIGAAFARLEIPVADVISSDYCRAWQTADLAFGRYRKEAALNFQKAEDYTDEQIATMRDALAPWLATRPSPGSNTVVVGHDDPFEAATGIYPEPMGVAYFVRPDSAGGFEILGAIDPSTWASLR